jgi:hypothetical protein
MSFVIEEVEKLMPDMSRLERQIMLAMGGLKIGDPYEEISARSVAETVKKIAALVQPQFDMMAAGATLEAQTIQTLMAMQTATVLAALIEEEGGGRANMSYSPMKMAEMMAIYGFTVEHDKLITTVRIFEKDQREPLFPKEDNPGGHLMKLPEEPKEWNRPIWAVRISGYTDEPYLRQCNDRDDAERVIRALSSTLITQVENRFCLHPDCPTTGCNETEATSDITQ